MQHKRCTLEMSDSFVSLWYSNHSGPSSLSLEACQNVPSLYWLQCLNTGIYTLFQGLLQPTNRETVGAKSVVDNEKQRITNGETDRQAKTNHPKPLMVLE